MREDATIFTQIERKRGPRFFREWDEMHFTELGWGSGMKRGVNRLGEESISLAFQSWFIQVPRKLSKPTEELPGSFPFLFLI